MTLSVLPGWRKRGAASGLLKFVLDEVSKWNNYEAEAGKGGRGDIARIALHVQSCNEGALEFYKKKGFRVVRREKEYYKKLDCQEAVYMELEV